LSPRSVTEELTPALEAALSEAHDEPVRVTGLVRRPSEYRSSFGLEELDVSLADGTNLELMFKDLGWEALDSQGRRAKPRFLYDPVREIGVYRSLLASAGLGTAAYHGSVVDAAGGRFWLFVERVAGIELYQVGEVARWEEAARWLAGMHAALGGDPERRAAEGRLLRQDRAFHRRWIERPCEFASQEGRPSPQRRRLESLAARYDEVAGRLLALPQGVIHGELYASNLIVDPAGGRVCPVDWEMAAVGPPLSDLAALTTGWDRPVQARLERTYHDALDAAHAWARGYEAFAEGVTLCRLQLAVQWLGWAPPGWVPPEDHRRDWLDDAIRLADELGL